MINIDSIKALDIYDVVVASYATQQSLIRNATAQSVLIRPRLLTPQQMIELVTFALPATWEGLVHQHLGYEPGFASVVAELLRSPESNHHHLPTSLQEFYAMLLAQGLVTRQQMISPSLSIGILGPVSQSLLVHLTSYSVEHIDWSRMESTIEYTMFDTQYEEVVHVFEEIAKQVEHQPLDSIAILAPEANYKTLIDTIAARFDLPVQWQDGTPLVHHPVVFELLQTLKTQPWSLERFVDSLGRLLIHEDEVLQGIYTQLLRVVSNYQVTDLDESTIQAVIEHHMHSLTYRPARLKHVIKIYQSTGQFIDASHVIVLGVNQGVYPSISTTTSLISDVTRGLLQLATNAEKTKQALDEFLWFCQLKDSIWMTAKKRSTERVYAPSILFSDDHSMIPFRTKEVAFDTANRYSKAQDLLRYKKELHRQRRQGFFSDELEILHHQLKDELPETYNNQFKGISDSIMKEFSPSDVASYSSLNTFFNCQFRFWMEHVLSVDPFETSLSLFLGNMGHYVIKELGFDYGGEQYREKVQAYADEYLNQLEETLSASERFYLRHVVQYFIRAVELLQQFQQHSKFELQFIEQSMTLPLRNSLMTLKGIVDHVSMYTSEDGIEHVLIVDYKTGNAQTKYAKIEYGIDAQLFVYMLLIRETHLVEEPYFSGAFQFAMIPQSIPQKHDTKSYQQQLDDQLAFDGYVEDNIKVYEDIYDNDDSLFKVPVTKDHVFSKSYKKNYDQGSLHQLLDYLSAKIELASIEIKQGQFTINPKAFFTEKKQTLAKESDTSCTYCHLKDVCYRTEEDFVRITNDTKQTFSELLQTIEETKGDSRK